MKNKKAVIGIVCAILLIIIICVISAIAFKPNKNKSENANTFGKNDQGELMYEPSDDIDFENVEVYTIKFKLKNTLEKNISKVYIRNNTEENFSTEICGELKAGEEKELEYGNYAPVFVWDLKVVFDDGEEKTLNSLLAANILYEDATLEITPIGDGIQAVNNNMNAENVQEGTDEVVENTEDVVTEETTEENTEEVTEENTQEEQTEENATEETIEEN